MFIKFKFTLFLINYRSGIKLKINYSYGNVVDKTPKRLYSIKIFSGYIYLENIN